MTRAYAGKVNAHYGREGLAGALETALRKEGRPLDAVEPADLAPLDQFHIRGREATLDLARLADIGPGLAVLDVGGGLGGAARTLAGELVCRVTVLDLTEEYCRIGAWLTRLTGLADRVTFRHGSALDMPVPDASVDVAWTQHSSMNVDDKERLYAEIHRVLRPGGRLAMHEIMAGSDGPIHFPVPWAREPGLSFLRPPDAVHGLLRRGGFREIVWTDVTGLSVEWLRRRLASPPPAGALSLELLLGGDFRAMFENLLLDLEQGRLRVVHGVWRVVKGTGDTKA
jgi:SAM-dependent methyltransferase